MYSSCLCIPGVYVFQLFMYSSCLCIPVVYVFQLFMCSSCLCVPVVNVFQLFMFSSCLSIPVVYVFQLFIYSSCLCIPVVYVFQLFIYSSCLCIPVVYVFHNGIILSILLLIMKYRYYIVFFKWKSTFNFPCWHPHIGQIKILKKRNNLWWQVLYINGVVQENWHSNMTSIIWTMESLPDISYLPYQGGIFHKNNPNVSPLDDLLFCIFRITPAYSYTSLLYNYLAFWKEHVNPFYSLKLPFY